MSFTAEVKTQICAAEWGECCARAQLSSVMKMCSTMNLSAQGIHLRVQCEHANTAKRIWKLLKERYQVEPQLSVLRKVRLKKNNIYVIRVHERAMEILKDLEICTDKGLQPRPSAKMVRKDCCAQAYLAGAFLAGGSVNAPTTSNYHLEISTSDQELAEFLCRLMNRFYLPAKIIQRRAQHVVYLKASDKIADFLRMCKADEALLEFEDTRIQLDFYNSLTRLDNCELANEMKSISAARKQLEDIAWIENYRSLDTLPERLQHVIEVRRAYPEASMNELCELCAERFGENISKSGMKHRLAKIREIAAQYRSDAE